MSKRNLAGQHLIVAPDAPCPACDQPAGGVLVWVAEGVQECRACWARRGVGKPKRRHGGAKDDGK